MNPVPTESRPGYSNHGCAGRVLFGGDRSFGGAQMT